MTYDQFSLIMEAAIDPGVQKPEPPTNDFEPLIKSVKDVPVSKERAEILKIAAQTREIEAKTQSLLNPQPEMDPEIAGQIDPATGMPIADPNAAVNDPVVSAQDDPLMGFGSSQDPTGGMGGGMDPMTGMPMPDMTKTFSALGRAYKLKHIYNILKTLKDILHTNPDIELISTSKNIDTAFDLFRLVVNNLKSYKDQIDDLIINYYILIKESCSLIERHFGDKSLSVKESTHIKSTISKCLYELNEKF